MSESLTYLPAAVGVSTNVTTLCPLETVNISSKELSECFIRAQQSNSHTRPVPTATKEIKRTLDKLDSFHSSQLDIFLRAYMFAAKKQNIIPRSHLDDPLSLSQLRSTLPTLKHVPEITVNTCHFCFTANFDNTSYDNFQSMALYASSHPYSSSSHLELSPLSSAANNINRDMRGMSNTVNFDNNNTIYSNNSNEIKMINEVYSGKVKLTNSGRHTITLSVWQTQTVIDGVSVENRFIETSIEKQVLKAKESMEMTLTLKEAPRTGFSDFQQLIVLGVDGVLKVFITFTVICPRQVIFRQRFPNCLPLQILHSPLGVYDAPLMLQILKHALIKQKGLSDPCVINLLVCNSSNYTSQNISIVSQALRVQEILLEQMNLSTILESFWASQTLSRKDVELSKNKQLPASAAQPAGYLPGIDLPTKDSVSGESELFPNTSTKLPEVLTRAPAPVYLETVFPHIRGIILWVIDLCCAFLINAPVNGCTVRDLAITFAAILDRPTQSSANSPLEKMSKMEELSQQEKHIDAKENITTPISTKTDDDGQKKKIISDELINERTSENNSDDNVTNMEHQVGDGTTDNISAKDENKNTIITSSRVNSGSDNINDKDENCRSNVNNNAKGEEHIRSKTVRENICETDSVKSISTIEQSKTSNTFTTNHNINNFQMCVTFRQNIVTALLT